MKSSGKTQVLTESRLCKGVMSWKINNYLFCDKGTDEYLEIPKVEIAGYEWQVQLTFS